MLTWDFFLFFLYQLIFFFIYLCKQFPSIIDMTIMTKMKFVINSMSKLNVFKTWGQKWEPKIQNWKRSFGKKKRRSRECLSFILVGVCKTSPKLTQLTDADDTVPTVALIEWAEAGVWTSSSIPMPVWWNHRIEKSETETVPNRTEPIQDLEFCFFYLLFFLWSW